MGATVIFDAFEWDSEKAEMNLAKHGVSFEEAATVLRAEEVLMVADAEDSRRVVSIGYSAAARVLTVVSSEVVRDRIRIISARRATRSERRAFMAG